MQTSPPAHVYIHVNHSETHSALQRKRLQMEVVRPNYWPYALLYIQENAAKDGLDDSVFAKCTL